jgi:cell division protein FtsB
MKRLLRSVVIIILVFASLALSRSIYNQASRFKEIYQAEDKVGKLTKEQKDLGTLLEKRKSAFFLEKQARDKLGFQRPGDVLYVIFSPGSVGEEKGKTNGKNWEDWVDLLFR